MRAWIVAGSACRGFTTNDPSKDTESCSGPTLLERPGTGFTTNDPSKDTESQRLARRWQSRRPGFTTNDPSKDTERSNGAL